MQAGASNGSLVPAHCSGVLALPLLSVCVRGMQPPNCPCSSSLHMPQKWDELDTLKGLDAVIDCVGEADGFARMKAGKVVRDDGSFVTIASFDAGFDPKAHTPLAFASFHCLANKPAVQDELAAMLVEKKLKVVVEKEYPFTEAGVRDMMAAQIGGKAMGKLVLRVDAN